MYSLSVPTDSSSLNTVSHSPNRSVTQLCLSPLQVDPVATREVSLAHPLTMCTAMRRYVLEHDWQSRRSSRCGAMRCM